MKWIKTNSSLENEGYELWDGTKRILEVSVNHIYQMVNITIGRIKRRFMTQDSTFSRSLSILRNEYGIKMAELKKINSKEGTIRIEGETLNYSIDNADTIKILKTHKEKPSTMIDEIAITRSSHDQSVKDENTSILLLIWGWHTFLMQAESRQEIVV